MCKFIICVYITIKTIDLQFPILFLGEDEIHDEKKTPLEEALGFLDIFLDGNLYVCGQNLTIADCSLAATVSTMAVRIHMHIIMLKCLIL